MRRHTLPLVTALASSLATTLAAQNVVDLEGAYHVGCYFCTVGDPVSSGQALAAAVGSAVFQTHGTFGVTFVGRDITRAGISPFVESYGGAYTVDLAGAIGLELAPGEWWRGAIDSRGQVLHATRRATAPEAFGMLAIRASTNHSAALVSGTYQLRSLTVRGDVHPTEGHRLRVTTSGALVTMDGLGFVFPGGQGYSVASNGQMTLQGAPGAVTATGDAFFVVHGATAGDTAGITVGVRVATTPADLRLLRGRWSAQSQGFIEDTGAAPPGPPPPPETPQSATDWFALSLATPGSATLGTFGLSGSSVLTNAFPNPLVYPSTNPNGQCPNNTLPRCTWVETTSVSGDVVTTGQGRMTLRVAGTPIAELLVSDTGNYCVGAIPGEDTILFGLRHGGTATVYGAATPGSGGVAPVLGMRGFADLGNATFGYLLTQGLGAAPAALAIGFSGSAGLPLLGGLLFVDPPSIVTVPFLALGGPAQPGAGAALHGVPIPNSTWLVGVNLFAQGLILDPGAAAGLAMTRALQVVLTL
jgi:hypothetical protein